MGIIAPLSEEEAWLIVCGFLKEEAAQALKRAEGDREGAPKALCRPLKGSRRLWRMGGAKRNSFEEEIDEMVDDEPVMESMFEGDFSRTTRQSRRVVSRSW